MWKWTEQIHKAKERFMFIRCQPCELHGGQLLGMSEDFRQNKDCWRTASSIARKATRWNTLAWNGFCHQADLAAEPNRTKIYSINKWLRTLIILLCCYCISLNEFAELWEMVETIRAVVSSQHLRDKPSQPSPEKGIMEIFHTQAQMYLRCAPQHRDTSRLVVTAATERWLMTHMRTRSRTHARTHARTHTHTRTDVRTHARTHARTHTCKSALAQRTCIYIWLQTRSSV